MIKSSVIQESIMEFLRDGEDRTVQEIKSYLESQGNSDYTEGQFSGSINTLLRNKSIKRRGRGLYAASGGPEEEKSSVKTCFVVSPIGAEGSETRVNADKLFKYIIRPVCQKCGFEPVRVDQINDTDSITQTIIEKLSSSELVIADITGHNPNVFYEMGYRKCTNKAIIHLKAKGESIPFDVNTIRTLEYDLGDLDNVEEIKGRLEQTIKAFSFEPRDSEGDENMREQSVSQKILPVLYQVLDSIAEVKELLARKDTEVIQAIMQTILNNAKREESPDAIMMRALFPEVIKNPELLRNLMQIAKMDHQS